MAQGLDYLTNLLNLFYYVLFLPFSISKSKTGVYTVEEPNWKFRRILVAFVFVLLVYDRICQILVNFRTWYYDQELTKYLWGVAICQKPLLVLLWWYVVWKAKPYIIVILTALGHIDGDASATRKPLNMTPNVDQPTREPEPMACETMIQKVLTMWPFGLVVAISPLYFLLMSYPTEGEYTVSNAANFVSNTILQVYNATEAGTVTQIVICTVHLFAATEFWILENGIVVLPVAVGIFLSHVMDDFTTFYKENGNFKQVIRKYEMVKQVVESTNECFGWIYVLQIATVLIYLPIFLGTIRSGLDFQLGFTQSVMFCIVMGVWMLMEGLMIYYASCVHLKGSRFYTWIATRSEQSYSSDDGIVDGPGKNGGDSFPCHVISSLRIDMASGVLIMKGKGFFHLTPSLATTLFGASVTYSIIVLQFDIASKN